MTTAIFQCRICGQPITRKEGRHWAKGHVPPTVAAKWAWLHVDSALDKEHRAEFGGDGWEVEEARTGRGPASGGPCPQCGRTMSVREAQEQGECNDCHPGGAVILAW